MFYSQNKKNINCNIKCPQNLSDVFPNNATYCLRLLKIIVMADKQSSAYLPLTTTMHK